MTLVEYEIHRIDCEWIPGKQSESHAMVLGFDYDVYKLREDLSQYRMDLYINADPNEGFGGISIDTMITGFFSFEQGVPEKKRQSVVRHTGFDLLFSTLRGYLSTVTSNFPSKSFILPSIDVDQIVDSIENSKQQEQST